MASELSSFVTRLCAASQPCVTACARFLSASAACRCLAGRRKPERMPPLPSPPRANHRAQEDAVGDRPSLRLFFAFQPDANARLAVGALAGEVARITGGRVSRSENLHLT